MIKWNGIEYTVDMKAVYDGEGFIKLPDGTVLQIESWKSLIPLIPGKLRKVIVVAAKVKG